MAVFRCLSLSADEPERVEAAILGLCGVTSLEDLDEDELERYRHYAQHPLKINLTDRSRLLASGLFSPYRAASLLDWRQRCGDVLSLTELSALDGFGKEFAEMLAPFISLESAMLPGQRAREGHNVENTAVVRSSMKIQEHAFDWNLSSKYALSLDDSYEFGLAFKEPYGKPHKFPDSGAFHLSYSGRRWLSSAVLGAFQCRFGQGLCLWSGFSISSLDRTGAASRNPTFVSPYRGYDDSSALKGAAATFSFGHFNFSLLAAHPGLAATNLSWYCRRGQLGFTSYVSFNPSAPEASLPSVFPRQMDGCKVAADYRWNLKGTDIYGELVFDIYNMVPAAVAGVSRRACDELKLAALMRYYPTRYSSKYCGAVRGGTKCSDEHGIALLGDWRSGKHDGNFNLDLLYRPSKREGPLTVRPLQFKTAAIWNWKLTDCLGMSTKLSYRFRGYDVAPHRGELRTDFRYASGPWASSLRLDVSASSGAGGLVYADCLRRFELRHSLLDLYARLTAFHVDNWADRIYCYERDVPGSFSVSACYGRGVSASFVSGLAFPKGVKLHVRVSTVQYPRSSKDGKVEARLQLFVDI